MEAVTVVAAAAVIMAVVIMVVEATISAAGIMAAAIFTAGRRISVRSPDIVHSRAALAHRSFSAQRMNFAGGGRALNSRALARSYRHTAALHRPAMRASVTAGAALAGWQYGRSRGGGWWRHGNGGYGWVGPLFWPFAYFDIYDYALWGPRVGAPFWYYGYDDIYAGLFGPYDYQGLAGYLPPRGSPGAGPDRLALLCGEDSREIAGLPIDLIAQAIEPTEAQRAALDDLANASVTSAQKIKAACPTTVALTASGRLASMQQRIEAMISGVATVQPALDKLYGLLNDEQKARLNAVAEDQERKTERRRNRSVAQALRRDAAFGLAMAGRGDRGAAASDRCATHRPHRPAERQRQGGRHAGHIVPDRRGGHATGAARRRRQAARRHAGAGQTACAPRSMISMRC